MNNIVKSVLCKAAIMALVAAVMTFVVSAQTSRRPQSSQLDLAGTFVADRTNPVNGSNQWLMGGSVELGANGWRGLVVWRRWRMLRQAPSVRMECLESRHHPLWAVISLHTSGVVIYVEGLIGEANGFNSVFIGDTGATDSATAFALQIDGGMDWNFAKHCGIRVIEAKWTRTQFRNGTTDVQNHLLLGTGYIFRF